jgi:hypothetical protein
MRKPTSSTQLAAFLFVDSRWHEPHDAVQCRAHGSIFEFLFEFQTEFLSNFLFEFQVVRASNRSTIEGPLYVRNEGCRIDCLWKCARNCLPLRVPAWSHMKAYSFSTQFLQAALFWKTLHHIMYVCRWLPGFSRDSGAGTVPEQGVAICIADPHIWDVRLCRRHIAWACFLWSLAGLTNLEACPERSVKYW